jgi:hypothetical protein
MVLFRRIWASVGMDVPYVYFIDIITVLQVPRQATRNGKQFYPFIDDGGRKTGKNCRRLSRKAQTRYL